MKSLFLILILLTPQQRAKQYKLVEVFEDGIHSLVEGSIAITKTRLYWKSGSKVATFEVHHELLNYKSKDFYFLGRDTLVNDTAYALYRGVCIVMPEETDKYGGIIYMELRTWDKERIVRYKYK